MVKAAKNDLFGVFIGIIITVMEYGPKCIRAYFVQKKGARWTMGAKGSGTNAFVQFLSIFICAVSLQY